MLNRIVSRGSVYTKLFNRYSVLSPFYSSNYKSFAKKDKGRLSDSESKRGAKAFNSENTETFSYSSESSESTSSAQVSNVKQIQSIEGHTVTTYLKISHL